MFDLFMTGEDPTEVLLTAVTRGGNNTLAVLCTCSVTTVTRLLVTSRRRRLCSDGLC